MSADTQGQGGYAGPRSDRAVEDEVYESLPVERKAREGGSQSTVHRTTLRTRQSGGTLESGRTITIAELELGTSPTPCQADDLGPVGRQLPPPFRLFQCSSLLSPAGWESKVGGDVDNGGRKY